jgi:glycosyltransferase involved in cell wall biosynthesis
MNSTEIIREQEQESAAAVRLLYACDWPPSNLGGGPILMSRLLGEYPRHSITVLTSTRFVRVSPQEGRLSCHEIIVPLSEGYGRFGLGRIRIALNWLRIPFIAAAVTRVIRQRQIAAVLTVLHGQFYFAAALAARVSGVPYIVFVHDDYIGGMNFIGRWLTRTVMRNAAHIYCVSTGMQETIRSQFGVESELQRPATERPSFETVRPQSDELSIVYAGSITGAVEDSLRAVASLITSGKLRKYGIRKIKLHLYTVVKEEQKRAWGWDRPDIVIHSWVGQRELPHVLRKADILFLPFSFAPEERHSVETAFPSKTADYLASGTPILVFGPNYSSLVAYARREGFAEIVMEPDAELLAGAIWRIVLDPAHGQMLRSRALAVFSKYHDIGQQRADFLQVLNAIVGERSGHAAIRTI